MALDERLVQKGQGEPRDALAQEGKVHVALAKQYAVELDDAGWPLTDTKDLESNVALLNAAVGAQSGARDDAAAATSLEHAGIDDAKSLIRRIRNALPRALRESPGAGVTMQSFAAGETLGRSTPRISNYLSKIRPAVAKLDVALAKAFKTKPASIVLDAVKAALDAADTAQEVALKNAPDNTKKLYEVMGKVLEQIEDMNRAGKTAFEKDAATAAKFNKDILLRGRKAAKKAEAGDGTAPAGTGGAAPAAPGGAAPAAAPAAPGGAAPAAAPAAPASAAPAAAPGGAAPAAASGGGGEAPQAAKGSGGTGG